MATALSLAPTFWTNLFRGLEGTRRGGLEDVDGYESAGGTCIHSLARWTSSDDWYANPFEMNRRRGLVGDDDVCRGGDDGVEGDVIQGVVVDALDADNALDLSGAFGTCTMRRRGLGGDGGQSRGGDGGHAIVSESIFSSVSSTFALELDLSLKLSD